MSETKQRVAVHIRWMIARDLPEVLEIEQSAANPWHAACFSRWCRRRDAISMVAEIGDAVVAFMVYRLHDTQFEMIRFAVHPRHRRSGVGSQMIAKMVAKLSLHRRFLIEWRVRETNLVGQLFLRANGFRAVEVQRDSYRDTGEAAYVMRLSLPSI